MKKFSLALLAVAAALAITQSASATTISGSIGVTAFDATWTANPGGSVTLPALGLAGGGSGSFAGAGGLAELNGFTFSSPDIELFIVVTGSNNPITFTISGPVTVVQDTPSELDITGVGTLTENGFTNTPAPDDFILNVNDASGHYGDAYVNNLGVPVIGSSSVAITAYVPSNATPEPGSFLLLGTGLLGLAFFASRKAKASRATLSL